VDHVDVWVDGIDESTDKPVDPESDKGNDVTVHTPTPTSTSTPTPTNTPVPTSTP
jgi:hypothetical protein